MIGWTWWLRAGDGSAKRITPGGLLIGRSARCDLVLADEEASRRHALVHLGADGPRIVSLGHIAPSVDGVRASGTVELSEGASIAIFGLTLSVTRERASEPESDAAWVIAAPSGALFGVSSSPFLVGGDVEDDLLVEAWPAAALCFRIDAEGDLTVEPREPIEVNGEAQAAGVATRVKPSDVLTLGEATVKIVTGGDLNNASTVRKEPRTGRPIAPPKAARAVTSARLEFLSRGARLHLDVGGATHSVYLTDRRSDLIAILLQPPSPHAPGDFLEDEVVLVRVWGKKRVDRTNLNVLLHRVRKDLTRVGLDGGAILERSEGGGATRFVLDPNATVELA